MLRDASRQIRMSLLVLFCLLAPVASAQEQTPQQLFDRTWSLVESSFLDPTLGGLDATALRAEAKKALSGVRDKEEAVAVINGFLARLKTSHTHLYCDQDPLYYELLDIFATSNLESAIRERFAGELPHYTGILATFEGEAVVDVVPGGPADKAALRVGDRVLGIADKPAGPFVAFHPLHSLEDHAGREIFLRVQSGLVIDVRRLLPAEIQPHQAFLQSVTDSVDIVEVEGKRLGYVRIYSYASEEYQERLLELLEGPLASADGLVLDLRGGWGGAQIEYLEMFQRLPELTIKPRDSQAIVMRSGRWRRPVVMVADGRSRSGKELMAYGFKDQRFGPLVGSRTAGAVSAGRLFLLPDGCALYLAVASADVDGHNLEGVGVAPDEIMLEPTLPSAGPSVKEQALQRLLQEIRTGRRS